MLRSGMSTFDNPDRFQAQFRGGDVDLVFTAPGTFKARQTWVELPHLSLVATRENIARIASRSFRPGRTYISFPVHVDSGVIWNGVSLRSNEIILHRPCSRTFDRWDNASWNFISVDPAHLHAIGMAMTGRAWVGRDLDLILTPSLAAVTRLRRLHAKACKLAETNPNMLMHREVGRAIEQEMIRVLIDCIYTGAEDRSAKTLARHIAIMSALEDVLTANIERDVALPELFDTVGVPERTLRLYCNMFLGMGPRRYLQLRRLNRVRAALQNADPETTLVAQIAQRYRFSELGRFAAAYRAVFCETPSETLRRKKQGHDFGFAANA